MKEYQKNIINEYVSTAMISEEPEEHISHIIYFLIDIFVNTDEKLHEVVEYVYEKEKKIKIR
jgi:hypothetical protein